MRTLLCALLAGLLAAPAPARALALGGLTLYSALNERLDARIDLVALQVTNLELAVDFAFQSAEGLNLDLGEGLAAVAVHERDQANRDLNADGDRGDSVVHVIDIETRAIWNTGVPSYAFDYAFGQHALVFSGADASSGVRRFEAATAPGAQAR